MAQKKLAAKTANTKSKAANAGSTIVDSLGFDPKNRIVEIVPTGKTFTVRKPETGFEQTGLSKADAQEVFEQQKSCSHNQ